MNPVYLDHAATTPLRAEVRDAMAPYLTERFGNPSSQHRWGREASAALENARADVAAALGAKASEVFFVRGGTEGDNLAIQGACRSRAAKGVTPTLVVTGIEHHAVLEVAEHAAHEGFADLVVLKVSPDGSIDVEALRAALAAGPCVVSCMWVNNETGILMPVPEIAEMVSEHGGTLHTDAVQAVGKVPVDLTAVGVHLLTVSGHKLYGPKGTGVLFVRSGTDLSPLLHGGGQERALRPGTEDVAGAVGVATALRLAVAEQKAEARRLASLRDELEGHLTRGIEGVRVSGVEASRAPHISNVGIEGVNGALLLINLDLEGIAASGASACSSGSGKGSHVIAALYGEDDTAAHVRFSLGRSTGPAEIAFAAKTTAEIVGRLRDLA